MILIVLLLTVGSGAIASQIAADIRSARSYHESAKAFYIAWSSVANGRTWMTSGARRTAAGNNTLCGAGTSNNDCAVSVTGFVVATEFYDRDSQGVALPAGDIRRGRREYSFQILQPDNVNAVLGDGQVKIIGSFPGNDRVATRDPMSRTALLEVTVWRDMKAFDLPLNNFQAGFPPANAINTDVTQCDNQWQEADATGTLYVDFGQTEIVRNVTLYHQDNTIASVTIQSWDDNTGTWTLPTSYAPTNSQTCTDGSGPTTVARTVAAFGLDITTRRLRFNVTASGPNANIRDIQVTNAGGQDVRRKGSVRPGRFSYSTNFDYTQFN